MNPEMGLLRDGMEIRINLLATGLVLVCDKKGTRLFQAVITYFTCKSSSFDVLEI
jgi:hypothetical protein